MKNNFHFKFPQTKPKQSLKKKAGEQRLVQVATFYSSMELLTVWIAPSKELFERCHFSKEAKQFRV